MNLDGLFGLNQEGGKRMKPFWIALIAAVLVTPLCLMSYWVRNSSETNQGLVFFLIVLSLPGIMILCWALHKDRD